MAPLAVEACGLKKSFGAVQALKGVSFDVKEGEIFGLVGPDGAGKSTTLRILASVMLPDAGRSSVAGFSSQAQSDSVKDHMAYMSQKFGLYPDLTVMENVLFYADLYGVPKAEQTAKADELLHFSYMHPFKERRAGNLSGGMKQKLQLICALIHTPRVLLLDEPTNGVDPVSRRDFWRILYKLLDQGVSILVSTAYMDEAERCDRVALIDRGTILAQGTVEELRRGAGKGMLCVLSPKVREAAAAFREDGRWPVTLFGDSIHLLCGDPGKTAPDARELLGSKDIPVSSMTPQELSLEDIFLCMTSGGEAQGASEKIAARELSDFPGGIAVSVKELTKKFGAFTAVDRVSFEVKQGEIFGFLGPNGAGKSTVIRMLYGLLTPTSGGGSVGGWDVMAQSERIKEHIGYMSQKFSLYDDLRVDENIGFYGGIYGLDGAALRDRTEWALRVAGLRDRRRDMTSTLSGGWKQKLALACALLHSPPMVFLDEPTSGVDPVSRRSFWRMIQQMSDEGVTVFVTTHYMEEAEFCNRICLIFRGRMIALGAPGDLKAEMKEKILELKIPEPQKHLEDLLKLPLVSDAALFGSAVHLSSGDPEGLEKSLWAFLQREKLPLLGLRPIAPSMEDVFVSAVARADEKGGSEK